jgi:hypothetical protein
MKKIATLVVVATMVVGMLTGCGDVTKKDVSRGIQPPEDISVFNDARSETDKEQELKDYLEKKMSKESENTEELNKTLDEAGKDEDLIKPQTAPSNPNDANYSDISTTLESEGEITVAEQEAIGGFAGMEYTDKGKETYKLTDDEEIVIYDNPDAGFTVKATQRNGEAVVLEFSERVFNVDTSQELEKELLDKGKSITVNYPYGTGGIVLTITY